MLPRRRHVAAPPQAVWDVLADGWLYPLFVVGTTSMRAVDATWPAPGSRLHHSVGAWPLVVQDSTVVRAAQAPHRLELTARGWPMGEATIVFQLDPEGAGTLVSLAEDASRGPGLLVPRPLRTAAAHLRNDETLRRLEHLARGRAGLGAPPGSL